MILLDDVPSDSPTCGPLPDSLPVACVQVDLSAPPPFTLADLKNAIPPHCYKKNTAKSVSYLIRDVAVVFGLAAAAYAVNTW